MRQTAVSASVSTLAHEARDNSVKDAAFVPEPLFAGTQRPEVLRSSGAAISFELELDAPKRFRTDVHIKVNPRVRRVGREGRPVILLHLLIHGDRCLILYAAHHLAHVWSDRNVIDPDAASKRLFLHHWTLHWTV